MVDVDTRAVLDTRGLLDFSGGTWTGWELAGHVKLRVVNVAGYNAVLSALTFDTAT